MNEETLNVQLFNTKEKGQIVGLNYFSSIANSVETKVRDICKNIVKTPKDILTIYKGDILGILDEKEKSKKYYVFNGGGNISRSKNTIELKGINKKLEQRLHITLNKNTFAKRVKIDFFGNIVVV